MLTAQFAVNKRIFPDTWNLRWEHDFLKYKYCSLWKFKIAEIRIYCFLTVPILWPLFQAANINLLFLLSDLILITQFETLTNLYYKIMNVNYKINSIKFYHSCMSMAALLWWFFTLNIVKFVSILYLTYSVVS